MKTTPSRLIEMPNRDLFLHIQKERMNEALCALGSAVPSSHLYGTIEAIREETGLVLSEPNLRRLLDLHPVVRGLLSKSNPAHESDIRDQIYDMIAGFFLGCRWPLNRDNVDMGAFRDILKAQASAMDFVTT